MAGLVFSNHVFSPDAFKTPPNEELVVSCRFGAGGQSHPPSCGFLEVGDLKWAGSDRVIAPVPQLRNWWFVKCGRRVRARTISQ